VVLKKKDYIIIGSTLLVWALVLSYIKKNKITSLINNEPENKVWDAVFAGGVDDRKGYYKLPEQLKLFKKGYGEDKKVMGFRYVEKTDNIIEFLKEHPKTPVFLFSAGCNKSYQILQSGYSDKNKFFIIQPYGVSSNTKTIVRNSVKYGVPAKNVFIGNSESTGLGIISGATPSGGHWESLTFVGNLKKGV
jgi:hypothetical protein